MQRSVSLTRLKIACSDCNLRELCLPVDLNAQEIQQLCDLSHAKHAYSRGDYLYRSGGKFGSLYAIYSGSFKTQVLHEDGREQVTGFQMVGEIIGLDAICTDRHTCDAVALENSEVCELPFNKLEVLSRKLPSLQRHLHKIMSREIVRDQGIMLLPTQFQLRMSRQEIGSYLGLKLETVSRAFSNFQDSGLINVKARSVELLELSGLHALVGKQQ